jgi:hypothetical protein
MWGRVILGAVVAVMAATWLAAIWLLLFGDPQSVAFAQMGISRPLTAQTAKRPVARPPLSASE